MLTQIFDCKASLDQGGVVLSALTKGISKNEGIQTCRKVLQGNGFSLSFGQGSITAAGANDDRFPLLDLQLGIWLVDICLHTAIFISGRGIELKILHFFTSFV
jgi:hypothetical protein